MLTESAVKANHAKPQWQRTTIDFLKLLGAVILALTTLFLTIRGGLLYASYIRAAYSWTYLIVPLLMIACTVIYIWWIQKE